MAKIRARTQRRRHERSAKRLVHDREKLQRLEPGGAPDRPLEVDSSSVIPGRARSQPCAQCGGALQLDEETAESVGGKRLRLAHLTCRRCGAPRELWFRIGSPLPN